MLRVFLLIFVILPASACISAEVVVLEAGPKKSWMRGNLHTHSHWSDGDDYLESIASWYSNQDYDFLVFTDHNEIADSERWEPVDKTKGGRHAFEHLKQLFPNWVEEREIGGVTEVRLRRFDEVAEKLNRPGEFLLVRGEEISDAFEQIPIHMNVSNVQRLIQPRHGRDVFDTIQNNVRAAQKQQEETGQPMLIHLNHPNFGYAVTAEDLMRVQGEQFFEVYNGHPAVHNRGDAEHAGAERIWDIVLAHRLAVFDLPIMYGLAVDDGHDYHQIPSRHSNPGRGWVMVLSEELKAGALIEAMQRGEFYASSGVSLKRIETTKSGMSVEVDAKPGEAYTIEFVGTRRSVDLTGQPVVDSNGNPINATRRYSDKVGEVLKRVEGVRASYTFAGDELYVRARVTSSRLHPNPSEEGDFEQAWAQPVRVGNR